jgi:membrane dipeptidase
MKVIDHIDHIVQVAGIDHVGLGSDFFSLSTLPFPSDLNDASKYPALIEALQARGYSEEDIRKIAGQNFLRVLEENMKASERQKN